MRHQRGRRLEVRTRDEFELRVAHGAQSLTGWQIQTVDLTGCSTLASVDVAGALFLGCTFDPGAEEAVRRRGGMVFPQVPDTPVDSYRAELYTPEELFAGLTPADGVLGVGYDATLDARAYAWSQQPPTAEVALARALHDHAIDQALGAWVAQRNVVGVMGGHAAQRGSPQYLEAAHLGHALAGRLTVATGGGPGAMEAANLGAWLSGSPASAVDEAAAELAQVPSFRPSVDAWAQAAFAVRGRSAGAESLGVPTWHYGHEPPNPFATVIAKYFANAPREAILLQVCDAGIVFLPGAAGTVQEVFQDAAENYYADPSAISPMVLVGREYWTETLPAWPLLESLARGRDMAAQVHLVDTSDEAVEVVLARALDA